jgi:hypothetical protein
MQLVPLHVDMKNQLKMQRQGSQENLHDNGGNRERRNSIDMKFAEKMQRKGSQENMLDNYDNNAANNSNGGSREAGLYKFKNEGGFHYIETFRLNQTGSYSNFEAGQLSFTS